MDYYKILGVERSADQEAIKKAYRKLAQQHHPDRGGDEDKFKEISEAYATLSDQTKRAAYDNPGFGNQWGPHGSNFQENFFRDFESVFGFRRGNHQVTKPYKLGRNGQSFEYSIPMSIYESLMGIDREFTYAFNDICGDCHGLGGNDVEECSNCGGTGQVIRSQQGRGISFSSTSSCPICKGLGATVQDKCETCNGDRVIRRQEKLGVFLNGPLGLHKTMFVRGGGGKGVRGGKDGDLKLNIILQMPEVEKLTEEELEVIKNLGQSKGESNGAEPQSEQE